MTVNVPSAYVPMVKYASQHTGLAYQIVACQAYVESGFNANAVSPAGAEGWLQFEPGTFAAYGHGSPFNVWDETYAYVNFMNVLLHWSGGDVQKALAAYNAGQFNWQAGIGYANEILAMAGSSSSISVKAPPGQKTSELAFVPSISPDDWSYYIDRATFHLSVMCDRMTQYTIGIRRL